MNQHVQDIKNNGVPSCTYLSKPVFVDITCVTVVKSVSAMNLQYTLLQYLYIG